MAKRIISKKFLLLIFTLLFVRETEAQVWQKIVPLETSRENVNKMPDAQRLNDGSSLFDSENESITINYYKGGCISAIEKALKLSSETVVEVKIVPKTEVLVDIFSSRFYQGRYEKISVSNKQNIYIDSVNDLIIDGMVSENKPEIVSSFFLIPELSKLENCLLDKMNPIIRQALEKAQVKKEAGKIFFYDSTYLTYPELSRWNTKELDSFSKTLRESQNSKGVITVYAGREARRGEVTFWIEKLKSYLLEKYKIEKGKLVFVEGGHRKSAQATLLILNEESAIPPPTPTISPNEVKIQNAKKQ